MPPGTTDVMSIANALRVPSDLHVFIGGDSCLQLYTWNPGTRTRACTSFTDLQKRHPYWSINIKGSYAGATVRRIAQELPTKHTDIFDVAVIACRLSDAWGDSTKAFAEPGYLDAEVAELCVQLGRFRRVTLILGGSAALWNLDLGYDVMVRKVVFVARSLGIPTIDGTQYFAELTRPEDDWHSHNTEANHAAYVTR